MSENLNNEEIKAYINGLEIQIANYISTNSDLLLKVERLKAEGDRLKEAGDEMAFHIGNDEESQRKCADRWFDLREGKQS